MECYCGQLETVIRLKYMLSSEYRILIARIVRVAMKREFPYLAKAENKNKIMVVSALIARNIHARMYGANVDGVASPIWRNDGDQYPRVDASEMLKEDKLNEKVVDKCSCGVCELCVG
jgi:hypothetical protein